MKISHVKTVKQCLWIHSICFFGGLKVFALISPFCAAFISCEILQLTRGGCIIVNNFNEDWKMMLASRQASQLECSERSERTTNLLVSDVIAHLIHFQNAASFQTCFTIWAWTWQLCQKSSSCATGPQHGKNAHALKCLNFYFAHNVDEIKLQANTGGKEKAAVEERTCKWVMWRMSQCAKR